MARNKVQNIRSNQVSTVDGSPKLPTSGQIEYGELAVNYAKGKETISLKNSENEIIALSMHAEPNNINDITVDGVSVLDENDKIGKIDLSGKQDVIEDLDSIRDNIDELMDAVFPLSFTMSSSNGKSYEIGDSVNGTATFSITKKGQPVSGKTITVTPNEGTFTGYTWNKSGITSNATYTFKVDGSSVASKSTTYSFMYYRYLGNTTTALTTTTAAENFIKNTLVKNTGTRQLSTSISLSETKLSANNYYVFAVPNTDTTKKVKWVIKHTKTGGTIGYSVYGTLNLPSINQKTSAINYEYVVVPASSIDWDFLIEGTLVSK